MPNRSFRRGLVALATALLAACDGPAGSGKSSGKDTVVVFVAASLTNAIRPQLDSFSVATGVTVLTESGGSMEHVRKLTELHRIPDLLLLADDEVFPRFLVPNYTTWWSDFARNRMVVAYTDRSKGAAEISDSSWFRVLTRPGVEVGRADPNLAPVGYRTLGLFLMAELHYLQPGLARRLAESAPAKNVRGNAAELAALLAAGELDYIYEYESVARAQNFRYVVMPAGITGRPITYALSIPARAPHPGPAERLLGHLTSPATKDHLRRSFVDMLDAPVVHGSGAPRVLTTSPRP
ncbi:MAG TPA: extracellular solute-binding protein [Gemmatimonadaceae bacterium]|nr:extracellular solute-binding protein [Gemmatimonadaceae bacterium]